MIGSPERVKIQRSSIPKIRKIHSCVWKLQVKNSQNSQFWQKNGQVFVLNGQNFAKSEFSRHIEYDFLKEDHKNNFLTKNQEDSQRCLEVRGQELSKMSKFHRKWIQHLQITQSANFQQNLTTFKKSLSQGSIGGLK